MKKMICLVALCFALTGLAACVSGITQTVAQSGKPTEQVEKHMINPGQVFQNGSYIYFENVEILYDDGVFSVKNDRPDDIIITMKVVGVKTDGTYTLLQAPAFSGVDEAQHKKDLSENGWAVEQRTNRVRAGEELDAVASIFDLSSSGYPAPDIDGDGFYDIAFSIHPQEDADGVMVSTSDPETEIYKLKAG